MRDRNYSRNSNNFRRDHISRRSQRDHNYKYVRRDGGGYRNNNRFNNKRNRFNRPRRNFRRTKITAGKLDNELDNYMKHKNLKDYLDKDLEEYTKNAENQNNNTVKESITLPPVQEQSSNNVQNEKVEVKETKVEEVKPEEPKEEKQEEEKATKKGATKGKGKKGKK